MFQADDLPPGSRGASHTKLTQPLNTLNLLNYLPPGSRCAQIVATNGGMALASYSCKKKRERGRQEGGGAHLGPI